MLVLCSYNFFTLSTTLKRGHYYPSFRGEKTEVLGLPVSGKNNLLSILLSYLSHSGTCHQVSSDMPSQPCPSCLAPQYGTPLTSESVQIPSRLSMPGSFPSYTLPIAHTPLHLLFLSGHLSYVFAFSYQGILSS